MIAKLHVVWLGSDLNRANSRNLPDWKVVSGLEKYIWYDSRILTETQLIENENYVRSIGFIPVDISKEKLFESVEIERIYMMETGQLERPGVDKSSMSIRNWGMASDIVRMLILKQHGGFYCDSDIVPYDVSKIDTSSSPILVNTSGEQINNNAIYCGPGSESIINKYLEKVIDAYGGIESNYYYYLLFDFVNMTLSTTGPWVLEEVLEDNYNLMELREDDRYATSWVPSPTLDHGILLQRLTRDIPAMLCCMSRSEGHSCSVKIHRKALGELVSMEADDIVDTQQLPPCLFSQLGKLPEESKVFDILSILDAKLFRFHMYLVKAILENAGKSELFDTIYNRKDLLYGFQWTFSDKKERSMLYYHSFLCTLRDIINGSMEPSLDMY